MLTIGAQRAPPPRIELAVRPAIAARRATDDITASIASSLLRSMSPSSRFARATVLRFLRFSSGENR
ncbi:hypothetical protein [Paraburkholderia solisilvae]|uniref:hypothetical protein n=1 Tax=Paraburkholderia solisilvae TaxID=624376 RepID=UPI0015840BF2|nr:hypothetical protein [Paraburkholderia solisilvae]